MLILEKIDSLEFLDARERGGDMSEGVKGS